MRDLLKWLKDFLNKPWLVLFLTLAFFAVVYLDKLVLIIQHQLPGSSISGLATINDRIMLATFFGLLWYAWETNRIRIMQEKPILALYIRDNFLGQTRYATPFNGNAVNWCLSIRNMGCGAAFNVKIDCSKAKVRLCKEKIYAPLKDEQPFGVSVKGEQLNGAILKIKCNSISGNNYNFVYKIINFEEKDVEYLGSN